MTAINTARGGENDLYIVDSIQDLKPYSSIKLNQFTGLTNKRLKPELLDYLNAKTQSELSESGVRLSDKGLLCVSGTVIYLADNFSNKQILLQLELHDSKTKYFLGTVNIIGKAIGLRGIESAADAVAEGITEILISHDYPVSETTPL